MGPSVFRKIYIRSSSLCLYKHHARPTNSCTSIQVCSYMKCDLSTLYLNFPALFLRLYSLPYRSAPNVSIIIQRRVGDGLTARWYKYKVEALSSWCKDKVEALSSPGFVGEQKTSKRVCSTASIPSIVAWPLQQHGLSP